MTTIKNIRKTPDYGCNCGSWFNHWEHYSGYTSKFCAASRCTNRELEMSYVQLANSDNQNWYVIPLCKQHIETTGKLEVLTVLVDADTTDKCEITIYVNLMNHLHQYKNKTESTFKKIQKKITAIIHLHPIKQLQHSNI